MPLELDEFAKRYANAWCSQNPETVAAFFAEEGSLSVNDAAPAAGRAAITELARGFMTAFPDMVVTMDELIRISTFKIRSEQATVGFLDSQRAFSWPC